ncbi:hypothetical protein HK405_001808 [Cladochytrium tenue]|nr:hypothetical protein HK405_001808 [Cladochytrium tenue]
MREVEMTRPPKQPRKRQAAADICGDTTSDGGGRSSAGQTASGARASKRRCLAGEPIVDSTPSTVPASVAVTAVATVTATPGPQIAPTATWSTLVPSSSSASSSSTFASSSHAIAPAAPSRTASAAVASAAFVGNYGPYYSRRTRLSTALPAPLLAAGRLDPRLAFIDPAWVDGRRVLDVGCNAGAVSVAIAALLRPIHVLGVDIDPAMIRKARAHLAFRASLLGPPPQAAAAPAPPAPELEYFPVSAPLLIGSLPIIRPHDDDEDDGSGRNPPLVFPHNASFRCADFVTEPAPLRDQDRVHLVLALSVTKWVHLHGGDAALRLFFKKCHAWLRRGGVLLLEPQPSVGGPGYARAARRIDGAACETTTAADIGAATSTAASATAPTNPAASLALLPEMFSDYLLREVGFRSFRKLGDAPFAQGFRREVFAFFK